MPLKKIVFKPGVNRENTRYTTEGGFYESEKIRFRQGTPEVIGGWERISPNTFLGICRSLWNWVTLAAKNLIGVGTNLKFYIEAGGSYFDQTPVREVHSLGLNPFTTTSGFNVVAVYDANPSGISSGQFIVGDFVTFFNTAAVGGINLNSNYATTTGNYQTQAPVAAVTGSISGTVLTVTALSSGVIINGAAVTGTGVAAGTVITSFGSGAGGTGTYNVNVSQTVASVSMSITAPGLVATYFVTAATPATSSAAGGGATVVAQYEINTGAAISVPITGWGGGPWGGGGWGSGLSSINPLRIWNQTNFGQDLIFGPRGGNIYYWNAQIGYEPYKLPGGAISGSPGTALITDASFAVPNLTAIRFECDGGLLPAGISNDAVYYVRRINAAQFNISATPTGSLVTITTNGTGNTFISCRGIPLISLAGDGFAPIIQNAIAVSDASRFVLVFGCNDYNSVVQDPMLIRWSDQEDATTWFPAATNQAGSLRLSHGSKIITVQQTRQEIVVWTDSSLYSLQYLGPPFVWGSQLLGDNISIVGPNATVVANGVSYWMGVDKFYMYDGLIKTMRCDLRRHVFSDINTDQYDQVFAGTNEGFNEIWWFYCSAGSTAVDKYVVYNYLEDIWYYGSMGRTAWLDSGLRDYPYGATYLNNLVEHERGINDNASGTPLPIEAYITSSEFDIDDGHNFAFIWRILPDLTFRGSNASSPTATLYLYPLKNSGSGYTTPASVGGENYANVSRTAVLPIEEFTGQIYTRVRGRQLAFKIYSNQLDTTWQLGAPRFDIRPDGRR